MYKKFLSGVLAAAMVIGGAAYAAKPASVEAASAPKPKYTFSMNGASKNVVGVARKGDTSAGTTGNTKTGIVPTANKKAKLQYKKGKHGKALYISRTVGGKAASMGAQLKGVKLGSKSWTVSFWVKPEVSLSNYMSMFFTGNHIQDPKNTKWLSITQDSWLDNKANSPTIWSHSLTKGKNEQFPWYGYQNKKGTWTANSAVKANKWTHITLVVNTKKTSWDKKGYCEYGTKGKSGYVKSYHAWTYVNGKLFGNGTVAKGTMSNSNSFFLGLNAWDMGFKGYFDDVKLWDKALSPSQVKAIAK